MTLLLKNKHSLKVDDFNFKCCVGKNGITPFKKMIIKHLKEFLKLKSYYRKDRVKKPETKLKWLKLKTRWVGAMTLIK